MLVMTEIDSKSIQSAIKNVNLNNLQSRIRILSTLPEGLLLPLDLLQISQYTPQSNLTIQFVF